jgi:hypothetical protein
MSLFGVLRRVVRSLGLPESADFRVISTTTGLPVSRKKQIEPIGL